MCALGIAVLPDTKCLSFLCGFIFIIILAGRRSSQVDGNTDAQIVEIDMGRLGVKFGLSRTLWRLVKIILNVSDTLEYHNLV